MKIIIAGSRTITDPKWVRQAVLESKFPISSVVCGEAAGVDTMGEQWALDNGFPRHYFPALCKTHGKRAGMIRNAEMADFADGLIAIWDGVSRGTLNMIEQMKKRNKPIFILVTV